MADAPPAPDRLGDFRLVREVGRGGMGVVYEAEDLNLRRRVAVKLLRPDADDPSARQRLLREARSAAALRHDHVVTVHQVGQDGDTDFLVMEFLDGEALEHRLDQGPPPPVPEAVRVAREVAEGLAAAHARGVIHRDVKPGNVWLEAPAGRVKLLDFGLAKPAGTDTALTQPGVIAGTPGYMAPEQIYGGPLDGRTDLYALGCLLYRMLRGRLPYEQPGTMELLDAVVGHDPPHLGAVAGQYPAPLGDLLRTLLARNPDDRPPTAAGVARRLRDIEAGLANPGAVKPAPRPPARGSRAGVWVGVGVILLAAAVGLLAQFVPLFPAPPADPPTDPAAPPGPPLRVGVLHSRTGTFADSERGMIDAIHMAAEEVNAAGGVLGRPVELVEADGHSDEFEFARQAEKLITEGGVPVVFGCWSSSSHKQAAAVCNRHGRLLVYSSVYEGLEDDPWVVHAGGAPNQHLLPAAAFAYTELHKRRFFLVGSDYVYSRVAHQILRDRLAGLGAAVVGDEYVPLRGTDFGPVVERIKAAKADAVFNTVDGTSNAAFFHALSAGRVKPADVPTFWLSIGEEEMASFDLREIVGDFAAMPYFPAVESPANADFLRRLRQRFPGRGRVSDGTEASYAAVHLWAKAAAAAGSPDPGKVREAFRGLEFDAPEGKVTIDRKNLHAWRTARVARVDAGFQFHIEFESPRPVDPEPFPPTRTPAAWKDYLKGLYDGWGGRWEAPRPGRGGGP